MYVSRRTSRHCERHYDLTIFSSDCVELSKISVGAFVNCVCVLPDGNLVTGCDYKDGARIFSSSGNEIKRLCEGDSVSCVAVFGDEHLAIACDTGLFLFDSHGRKVGTWLQGYGVECMAPIPPNLTIRGRSGRLAFIAVHSEPASLIAMVNFWKKFWSCRTTPRCGPSVCFPTDVLPRVTATDVHASLTATATCCGRLRAVCRLVHVSGFMCVLPNGNLFTGGPDGAHILSSSGLYLVKLTDDRVTLILMRAAQRQLVCVRRSDVNSFSQGLHASINWIASD